MTLREKLEDHHNSYVQSARDQRPAGLSLRVSIVVPVYNSAASIAPCIATIAAQTQAGLINEVILINDGSTDTSLNELLIARQQHPQLKIIIIDNGSRKYAAYSRNRGIEQATGDLVCFIDSDILLPPDYIYRHALQHQADSRCVTFSLRSNVADSTLLTFPITNVASDFRDSLLTGQSSLQQAAFAFCPTHTLAELCLTCAVTYRRDDLVRVKGCPENFIGWGFNDTAMAAKVIGLGRSVVPIYDTTVGHLEHAPRSGNSAKKWTEFANNKQRYTAMLELPQAQTYQYHIEALDR